MVTHRSWFALQVKPRYEKIVSTILTEKGYDCYLPLYRCTQHGADRKVHAELPLFSGYTFCRITGAENGPILTTPGVVGIVGTGRRPTPLDDDEIEAIQRIAASDLPTSPCAIPMTGQIVEIIGGPLKGLRGIILEVGQRWNLIVSVTLLQRSVAVEIPAEVVRIAPGSRIGCGPALVDGAAGPKNGSTAVADRRAGKLHGSH
jgi:transcription antitermination factor NusG